LVGARHHRRHPPPGRRRGRRWRRLAPSLPLAEQPDRHRWHHLATRWHRGGRGDRRVGWRTGGDQLDHLDLSGGFSVSTLHPITIAREGGPTIALLDPARPLYTEGGPIAIAWEDENSDPSSTVKLSYDDNDIGADGTAIVDSLPADPDGAADTYSWNTEGVADGIYYLYGTITRTNRSASAYAPAPVAIDRAGLDGDGDTMADLWEDLLLGPRDGDGSGDLDLDGEPDADEFANRNDPTRPDPICVSR